MSFTVKSFKTMFESKDVEAKSIFEGDGLSIEYYHLFENHSLHINSDGGINNCYYLLLEGQLEALIEEKKIIVNQYDFLEVHTPKAFSLYAKKEVKLLFFTNELSKINKATDDLSYQIKVLEGKDDYLKNHNYRVGKYSLIILDNMNLNIHTDNLNFAAAFHDIGKIKIPDEILHKEDRLSDKEFEIIKKHPIYSYEILKEALGEEIAKIASMHHERLDGSGYPYGLKGDQIPIESQIIAVADIFDALTTKRSYRDAFSFEKAIEILNDLVNRNQISREIFEALKKAVDNKQIEDVIYI